MSEKEKNVNCTMVIDVNDLTIHNICFDRCESNKCIVLEAQNLSNVGRYLTLNTTVKNVCPNKRVALGIRLYETTNGCKVIKGHKEFSFSHNSKCCRDVTLSNIHFVLPEEIAETDDTSNICSRRTFNVETTSHYVDLDNIETNITV